MKFKRLFKRLPKKLLIVAAVLAVMLGIGAGANAAFGPDRPTRVWTAQENGFDHVTFNSYTGVPNGIGDERDFFRGLQVGRDSNWTDPVTNVSSNAEVEGKIYIHNNADPLLNDAPGNPGIAHNVTVKVALPTAIAKTQELNASISATNADPQMITDTLDFTSATDFGLKYETGTAQVHYQDGTVTTLTAEQETALLSGGWNMGDQSGCFQFVREITFKMKVNTPSYTLTKVVGMAGQSTSTLTKSVDAKAGDTLGWLITFTDNGDTELDHVKIVDNIPKGLTVVPGSVKLFNANYPNGYVYPPEAIQANGTQINVDIGNFGSTGNAHVSYRTTINNNDSVACGASQMVNNVFATPEGFGTITDTATANVTKECQVTTPSYTCNLLDVTPGNDRTVTVSQFNAPAAGGATFKSVDIDWGDKTPVLTTNTALGQQHTYGADKGNGPFTIVATAHFMVPGSNQDQLATSPSCSKPVSFTPAGTPVVTVSTPTTPTQLVNTGAGSTIALFAGVSVIGTFAYRLYLSRRLVRG